MVRRHKGVSQPGRQAGACRLSEGEARLKESLPACPGGHRRSENVGTENVRSLQSKLWERLRRSSRRRIHEADCRM